MTGDGRHFDHEALRDDLAAYALGALPEAEADELTAHLEHCARCRELLRWLTPAVDVLPAAVPQHTPPASLRENLMETVRAEAVEPNATARQPRRDAWWRPVSPPVLRPATALAAAALLAGGVAGGYLIDGDVDDRAQPSSSFVEARPLSGNPDVSATLELHGDSATLHVNELPKLAPDRVYEVWVERARVMEPSTLFVLDKEGSGTAAVPGPLEGSERVLVTEEPRGGSQRPTSPPLLAASLG